MHPFYADKKKVASTAAGVRLKDSKHAGRAGAQLIPRAPPLCKEKVIRWRRRRGEGGRKRMGPARPPARRRGRLRSRGWAGGAASGRSCSRSQKHPQPRSRRGSQPQPLSPPCWPWRGGRERGRRGRRGSGVGGGSEGAPMLPARALRTAVARPETPPLGSRHQLQPWRQQQSRPPAAEPVLERRRWRRLARGRRRRARGLRRRRRRRLRGRGWRQWSMQQRWRPGRRHQQWRMRWWWPGRGHLQRRRLERRRLGSASCLIG